MNPRRRRLMLAGAALPAAARAAGSMPPRDPTAGASPAALARRPLAFPRDFGAHGDTRIEWWYLTALLDPPDGNPAAAIGLQVTFFRLRTGIAPENPSRFAARQLIVAHAAIADPARGALLHDERIARTGFGLAQAADADTDVAVDRWSLARDPARGGYRGHVAATGFTIDITASPTQALLLQGEEGYSRKSGEGADPPAASFYYTEPQLDLTARIRAGGREVERRGRAWLDHEWSSTLLPTQAAGWDWGGFNLTDGSTLTVFRIRARGGDSPGQTLHAYACLRAPGSASRLVEPARIAYMPLRYWTSPRTRARYPVAQRIQVGERVFETEPLMPDQEYDARNAGGIVYWEGASHLLENGRPAGGGYLELTGYSGAALGAGSGL